MAVNLVEHGEYSLVAGHPCSARPPLYPAFLAGIYKLFGVENFFAVRIVQGLLGLLAAVLVYPLARQMVDASVANWAAGLVCFYPSLLGFGNLILSEILFTILLLAALLPLARHFRSGSIAPLIPFGALLGLATLTRSVLWPFFPFFMLYLFFAAKGRPWTTRVSAALVPAAAFALVIAPWAIRNTRLQETFVPVDCLGGRNMMMGNYEYTKHERMWATISVGGEKAWHRVLASEHPEYYELTQGQRDKLAMKRGFQFAFKHPFLTAKRNVIKFFNFWQLDRSLAAGLMQGYWGKLPKPIVFVLSALIFAAYALMLLAGVFGFVVLPSADQRMHWFLLLTVGFVCAVHTVVFAHSRYHISLMPIVFIYSGAALAGWRLIWQKRRTQRFWIATLLAALLVAGWIWEIVAVDAQRLGAATIHRVGWNKQITVPAALGQS